MSPFLVFLAMLLTLTAILDRLGLLSSSAARSHMRDLFFLPVLFREAIVSFSSGFVITLRIIATYHFCSVEANIVIASAFFPRMVAASLTILLEGSAPVDSI